jgi:hypothetical protein
MAMSSVARASLMKRAILAATPPICAVRSGVEIVPHLLEKHGFYVAVGSGHGFHSHSERLY